MNINQLTSINSWTISNYHDLTWFNHISQGYWTPQWPFESHESHVELPVAVWHRPGTPGLQRPGWRPRCRCWRRWGSRDGNYVLEPPRSWNAFGFTNNINQHMHIYIYIYVYMYVYICILGFHNIDQRRFHLCRWRPRFLSSQQVGSGKTLLVRMLAFKIKRLGF